MSSALLVMDVQKETINRLRDGPALLGRIHTAITSARSFGISVIFVVVGFRKGYPEISPRNRTFAAIRDSETFLADSGPDGGVHSSISLHPGDVVVTKRRVSAFSGSDLEVILRAQDIDTLVLCGIATSGVVLSTTRAAADMDYRLAVLSDCCADADQEVHDLLVSKVFPRQAEVLTAEEWSARLGKS